MERDYLIKLAQKQETELTDQEKEYLSNLTEDDEDKISFLVCINPYLVKYIDMTKKLIHSDYFGFYSMKENGFFKKIYETCKEKLQENNVFNQDEMIYEILTHNKIIANIFAQEFEKIDEEEFGKKIIETETKIVNELVQYLNPETLIEILTNGVEIPSITNNIDKLKEIIKKDTNIIEYINTNIITEDLVYYAIQNGYDRFIYDNYDENSKRIKEIIAKSEKIIKYMLEKNYHSGYAINNMDENILINLPRQTIIGVINNGYHIEEKTPQIIKDDPEYVALFIDNVKKGDNYYNINRIVNLSNEKGLTLENFEKACKLGYKFLLLDKELVAKGTPKFIIDNPNYLRILLTHTYNYSCYDEMDFYRTINNRTTIKSLTLENFKILLKKQNYINLKYINNVPQFVWEQPDYIKIMIEEFYSKKYNISLEEINNIQDYKELCYILLEKDVSLFEKINHLHNDKKALEIAIKTYPNAINYADESIVTDEIIMTVLDSGYEIGENSPKKLLQLKWIDYAIEKGQTTAILYTLQEEIENNTEEYKQLCYKVLEKNGALFSKITLLHSDKKALEIAIKRYQNAIEFVDDSLITDDILEQIKDFNSINLQNLSLKTLIKILNLEKFNYNSNVLQALISHINELDINFKFDEKTTNIILKNFTNDNFNECFSLLEHIEKKYMSEEFKQIFENSKTILKEFGKINTLEKNPVFSYDLIKYIYPVFGLELCKDLLKYNSGADKQIIKQIKEENINLIVDYYNKICPKLFNYSDKTLHFAFRYFDTIQDLVTDIIKNNIELSKEDLINLKKIIYNSNRYNIKTVEQLKNYKTTIENEINSIIESTNVANIKEFLSKSFGYNTLGYMKETFTNFQLDNFHKLNFVIESIKKSKIIEPEQLEKYMLTEAEEKIILLMKEIIETENIEELQQLIKDNIANNKEIMDYSDDVDRIINKIRNIYNLQFQTKLTDVKSLQSKKTSQTKTITIYNDQNDKIGHQEEVNYEIIDMDSEKFNFLAHRIYHYDPKMREFCEMLMNNPKLWTKLDGASTLSTSSISDKGFWMLHSNDNSGVIYLFNNLTENFMLFMYGRDLVVSHGGHKLEPTSTHNYFTDIEGLNQASVYRYCSYNEVAGMREGMMPCAIACVGQEPNDEQIRAATYFKIPIIRFNIKAYEEQNIENYKKAKEDFRTNPTTEKLDSIFLSGNIDPNDEELDTKCKYCFNILKEKYQNKEITQEEFIQRIAHIQSLLDRICDEENKDRNLIRKIELFIETFCSMQQITEEELIKLETANMGESGVMFKYQEGNKEYLLKPAVDKKEMKPQNFRAQIQKSASVLQKIISEDTAVEVDVIGDKTKLSKQEKIELSENKDALTNWVDGTGTIEKKQTNQLLQEYVVDFLLCNFDCFDGNFIIDKNNNVRGIDKEQSFRFIDNEETLRPDFSYVPNGLSRIPIYKIMFEKYKKGDIELDFNVFDQTIERVKLISDEQYKNIFRPYAESLNPRHPEVILEKILQRKHKCTSIMEEYINSIRYLHQSEEESQNERTRQNGCT